MVEKIAAEEAVLRRSTRVRATPRENSANSFLRYVNKWKEDEFRKLTNGKKIR